MRSRSTQRGQALVEFTLVAALLVVLLLAIAQFGVIYSNWVSVTDASREGARNAVVNRSNGQSGMISAATSAAKGALPNLKAASIGVSVTSGTGASGAWSQGAPITVTVTYPYSVRILGWAVKSGSLSSSTTMRTE